MSVTQEQVLERLTRVVDPCSLAMGGSRDIRELGLVERADVDGSSVTVEIVLTDPSCRFWQQIRQNIVDEVGDLDGVEHVDVSLSRTAVWMPRRLRDPGVVQLG